MGTSANEKVVVGVVGVAGRGLGALMKEAKSFDDVEIGAVCDVYEPHLDRAVAFTDGRARPYHDFRDLLDDRSLDAVFVATPPHWHALISLAAIDAGKDVYCEKPMCRFPTEGRLMAHSAERNGRITQVGTQIHATENYRKCVDIVRSGALGAISSVTSFTTMNDDSEGLGRPEDSLPPAGLDWDMWLGPAPEVPFNIGRFRDGMHRYFKDYVDSWLHELGPHIVELPFWALELPAPLSVAAVGGRYATESIADVPDTMNVLWEYPDKTATFTMLQANSFHFGVGLPHKGRHNGIVFHGKEATLTIVNYGTPEVLDRDGNSIVAEYPQSVPPSPGQLWEFIESVKSRTECSCSFSRQLPMHTAMNLAHLSLHLGRQLRWDDAKWEIIGDAEAQRLITPAYRAPWTLPAGKRACLGGAPARRICRSGYFRTAIISLQAAEQAAQDFAQSAIGFIFGYFLHSAPHASQASMQARQAAAVIGPLRAQTLAAVSQMSRQSALIAALLTCSFIPDFIIPSQWVLHSLQEAMQSAQAFAHFAYIAALGAAVAGTEAITRAATHNAMAAAREIRVVRNMPIAPFVIPDRRLA